MPSTLDDKQLDRFKNKIIDRLYKETNRYKDRYMDVNKTVMYYVG